VRLKIRQVFKDEKFTWQLPATMHQRLTQLADIRIIKHLVRTVSYSAEHRHRSSPSTKRDVKLYVCLRMLHIFEKWIYRYINDNTSRRSQLHSQPYQHHACTPFIATDSKSCSGIFSTIYNYGLLIWSASNLHSTHST
jgi:hypothetical protein